MKQIDIIRTYAQKRCLVVDDVPEARAHLKRLLVDFGAQDTDTAGNVQEAIDLCQKHQYDLVIAEYNLGQNKNGQQLLEELRHRELLRNSALFIMITAESASHYVLQALECAPDDFFQKPVNRDSLRPRLDQAILKNEHLLPIKTALDEHKIGKAIGAATDIARQGGKFQNDARKILAELYLKNRQIDDAEAVYQLLDDERLPLWADIGLAQISIMRKDYERAEQRLLGITEEYPHCVEAQDLLAKIYEQTHRPNQCQLALMNAVKISPRSAPRQRELGRVSQTIDDDNASVHAFRAAAKHSKNSCHEQPDDLINLANGLIRMARKSDKSTAQHLIHEAKSHLDTAQKRYGKHPIVHMRNTLIEADIFAQNGDADKADEATHKAVELHATMNYRVIANTSTQLCIDCAKAFINRGCPDEGEAILQELARLNNDEELAVKIDKLLRTPRTKEGIAFATRLNKEGISYYDENRVDEAILSFRTVLRELPNHIALNLNLIQALLTKGKEKNTPLNDTEKNLLQTCFLRVGKVDEKASHFKRYNYLHKRYQKLEK